MSKSVAACRSKTFRRERTNNGFAGGRQSVVKFRITSICKGGGYRYARTLPLHPRANSKGLYPLHRVLMENKIGRSLNFNDVVHHKDGNKDNNTIGNLELLSRSEHTRKHHIPIAPAKFNCGNCRVEVSVRPSVFRRRMKRSKGILFCSFYCSGKFYGQ